MIDRDLTHKGCQFGPRQAWSSLVIPVGVVLIAVGIVYLVGVMQDVMHRLYG